MVVSLEGNEEDLGKEQEAPVVLFRVILPSELKIKDGYFQPLYESVEYGLSLPMIARRDLLSICDQFGGKKLLISRKENFFYILAFRTSSLRKVIKHPGWDAPEAPQEYFAEAPTDSLISAMKFVWKDGSEGYDKSNMGNFSNCLQLVGKLSLDELMSQHAVVSDSVNEKPLLSLIQRLRGKKKSR